MANERLLRFIGFEDEDGNFYGNKDTIPINKKITPKYKEIDKMKEKVYEGKAKILYTAEDDKHLIQYFKDDATAGNGAKKGSFEQKGYLNNIISEHLMIHLEKAGIATHFIKRLNDREQLIRKLDMIPVEFIVRNVAAGSLCSRLGIEEGTNLLSNTGIPLIEFCLKDDSLNDPIIGETHIEYFGFLTANQIKSIKNKLTIINNKLIDKFNSINITLVDYKLELGWDGIRQSPLVGDEICPDTCRLWDKSTGEILDKDRFRKSLGGETEAYQEIARRLELI